MNSVPFELLVDGEVRRIVVELSDGRIFVREEDIVLEAEVRRVSGNELKLRWGDRSVRVILARDGERTFVSVDGRPYVVAESRSDAGRPGGGGDPAPGGSLRIKAPMPGKVTKIAVAAGEPVRCYQTLAIVEAMKMENEVKTSIEGVVTKVHVAVGDLVDAERILVEIEPKAA